MHTFGILSPQRRNPASTRRGCRPPAIRSTRIAKRALRLALLMGALPVVIDAGHAAAIYKTVHADGSVTYSDRTEAIDPNANRGAAAGDKRSVVRVTAGNVVAPQRAPGKSAAAERPAFRTAGNVGAAAVAGTVATSERESQGGARGKRAHPMPSSGGGGGGGGHTAGGPTAGYAKAWRSAHAPTRETVPPQVASRPEPAVPSDPAGTDTTAGSTAGGTGAAVATQSPSSAGSPASQSAPPAGEGAAMPQGSSSTGTSAAAADGGGAATSENGNPAPASTAQSGGGTAPGTGLTVADGHADSGSTTSAGDATGTTGATAATPPPAASTGAQATPKPSAPAAAPQTPIIVPTSTKFHLGITPHITQKSYDPAAIMRYTTQLGANAFRDAYYWHAVEQSKGVYTPRASLQLLERFILDAKAKGIAPILVLAYGNPHYDDSRFPASDEARAAFVRYAKYVATKFKGVVRCYELWNEWNKGAGYRSSPYDGDPAVYAKLLREVHAALKSVDPDITVVGGAVAGWDEAWIRSLLDTGALRYMDAISVHPYAFPHQPEKVVAWLERLQGILRGYNGGATLPIYITEIGWPTGGGSWGVADEVAGNYLARFFLLAPRLPDVKGATWYNLINSGSDALSREDNFGMLRADYTQKATFCAFKDISEIFRSRQYAWIGKWGDNVWIAKYAGASDNLFAVWTENNSAVKVRAKADAGKSLSVRALCRTTASSSGGSQVELQLSGAPLFVTTAAGGITLSEQ